MKTQLLKNTFVTIFFTITFLFSYSQNCTNCDVNNTINSANFSSALGIENTSTGQGSFASGKNDTVTGNYSTGLGFRAVATGANSFAAGGISKASGIGAMSYGHHIIASGTKSFVIGTGGSSTGLLENGNANSLVIGFGSSKPTFFVDTASSSSKTGTIGIGDVTSPAAKLHIKSDYLEEAAILLEPNIWDSDGWAEIRLGNNSNAVKGSYTYGLQFKTDNNYIFNSADANVGIGVLVPNAKLQVKGNIFIDDDNSGLILKSPDGQCWKATASNSGEFVLESIDCDLTTNTDDLQIQSGANVQIFPNPTKNTINIRNNSDAVLYAGVLDMEGTLLLTKKLINKETKISLKNLSAGYYIIRITNSNNQVITTEKIVKE